MDEKQKKMRKERIGNVKELVKIEKDYLQILKYGFVLCIPLDMGRRHTSFQ